MKKIWKTVGILFSIEIILTILGTIYSLFIMGCIFGDKCVVEKKPEGVKDEKNTKRIH